MPSLGHLQLAEQTNNRKFCKHGKKLYTPSMNKISSSLDNSKRVWWCTTYILSHQGHTEWMASNLTPFLPNYAPCFQAYFIVQYHSFLLPSLSYFIVHFFHKKLLPNLAHILLTNLAYFLSNMTHFLRSFFLIWHLFI